jgi:PQQ system protein
MPHGGNLQLDFSNDDDNHHIAMLPSDGDRQVLHLPPKTGGTVRLHLSNPGMLVRMPGCEPRWARDAGLDHRRG